MPSEKKQTMTHCKNHPAVGVSMVSMQLQDRRVWGWLMGAVAGELFGTAAARWLIIPSFLMQ